jgi:RHS repeat-associated protein
MGVQGGAALQDVNISGSLNATVSSSDTNTTTDVIDLTGDGIADVIAGDSMFVSTLVNGGVRTYSGLSIGDGFRRRTAHDYSFGFSQSASTPQTTSGGRPRSMTTQETPDQDIGGGQSEGISIGRSQTTQDLVDVNGDGLPDIVGRTGTAINVRYNLGDRFDNWSSFGTVDAALGAVPIDSFENFEDTKSVLGALRLKTNENALSHESTITQDLTYTVDLYFASASYSTKTTSSRTTRQFADLNGDGLPDLLLKKANEAVIHVQYNTGGTFGPATTWATPSWAGEVFPTFASSFSELFSGSNAVGGPDVLASTGTQDSTAFSGSVSIPIYGSLSLGLGGGVSYEKDTYELGLVDVTGDGAPDHVMRRGASNDPQYAYVKPNLADGRSNLLKKITSPLGGETTLEYELTKPSVNMPHAKQTLAKVTVDDKSPTSLEPNYSSPNLVTQYAYEGGYYDRLEKQFLGFRQILTWRPDGQIVEQTYENRDYTLQGLLIEETRDAAEGGPRLHTRVITREVRDVVDANGSTLPARQDCLDGLHALLRRLGDAACISKFSVVTKDEDFRYEGVASKKRTIDDLSFDRFGDVLESVDHADDASTTDDLYSSVAYQHDSTHWILGRPTSLQVRAGNANGALLRSRRGFYNSFGDPYQLEIDTGTTPSVATTTLTYDAYGNLQTLTTPPNEDGASQVYTLTRDPGLQTYVTTTTDAFSYQSQSAYDLRFGVVTTDTDLGGATIQRTFDAFGRLATVRGPYDTSSGDGITLTYFPLESPPRAVSITQASKPAGSVGTVPAPVRVETITNGFGETIELRKTGVVGFDTGPVAGVITSGLVQRDNLGRVIRAYQPFFTAGSSIGFVAPTATPYVVTQYDNQDRAVVTTYPDSATESVAYSVQVDSTGASRFRTQTTDSDGNQRESYSDLLGRTLEFVEHPDAGTSASSRYTYAPTGELLQVTDAQGNLTTLGYDMRGLRTSLRNPDTGLITDTFDAMGNRIRTQEPNHRKNNVSVEFHYNRDRLERIIYPAKPAIRTCSSGLTASVCYEYGGASGDPIARGRLVTVRDESGSQTHTYGLMGEIRETVRTIAPPSVSSVVFDHRYVWDSLGRLLSLRYPDGETIVNTYDAAGNLKQVDGATFNTSYARDIRYDIFGNRTHLTYGNNVESTWSYDYNRVRLASLTTRLPATAAFPNRPIQQLSYSYSNNGHGKNFASVTNSVPSILNTDPTNVPGTSTVTFTYDGVDRLLNATGTAELNAQKTTSYDESFTYSTSHNLLTKQRVRREFQNGTQNYSYEPDQQLDRCSSPPCAAATYTYAAAWDSACNGGESGIRPHLPSQVGASNFGVLMQYDCSGNPTVRQKGDTGSTQLLTWDDDGRLTDSQEAGAGQHNTYDASGVRVRRASSNGGQNNVTIYSSQFFDLDGNTSGMRHVFAGNLRVATELTSFASSASPPAPTAPGTRYFFHSDHLGSTTILTDQSTTNPTVYQSTEYFVDGAEWLDRAPQNTTNAYLFNGKAFDVDTKLYDFGQRFYDPRTSLWLGVDPALTDSPSKAIGRPMMMSVGAYANQSPFIVMDPDGREPPLQGLNGIPDPMTTQLNFEWGGIKDTLFAPVRTYEAQKTRVHGAGKVAGGIALMHLGAGLCTMSFGVGCGVGGMMVAVGSDLAATGAIEVATNEPRHTYLGQAGGNTVEKLQIAAGDGAALIDMVFGGGGGGGGDDVTGGDGGGGGFGGGGGADPEFLFHYTISKYGPSIKTQGLWPQSSVTDVGTYTADEAVNLLGVRTPPDIVVKIRNEGQFVRRGKPVQPTPQTAGGALEWTNKKLVPPRCIICIDPVKQ